MDVSVAICAWNRAALLDRTLEQIFRLEVSTGEE
jgi:glycosyltransferase involved in cell wall biosynthesis